MQGRGQGGQGRGRAGGRGPSRAGGPSKCICPSCGHEEKHVRGQPCSSRKCPECGARMIGKWG